MAEHHLMGPKVTEASKKLGKLGWKGSLVRAQSTINGGRQGHGGVGVVSRSHLHTSVPTDEQKLLFPEQMPPLPQMSCLSPCFGQTTIARDWCAPLDCCESAARRRRVVDSSLLMRDMR